jgi:hypothetical protein
MDNYLRYINQNLHYTDTRFLSKPKHLYEDYIKDETYVPHINRKQFYKTLDFIFGKRKKYNGYEYYTNIKNNQDLKNDEYINNLINNRYI